MTAACQTLLARALDLVVPRRGAGLARGDRLHRRLRRRRHADRRAVARGVHGHRRRRADVRHHARARQCRSVAARQHRPGERGRDEDDGRRRFAGRASASSAALGCGLAVGVANYLLIWALRIPPIIATLSASFIIQSIDISYGRGLQIKPPPGFADFTNIQIARRPAARDPDGAVRRRRAMSRCTARSRAARCWRSGRTSAPRGSPGIRVEPVRFATYALCGALGGLDGALLAGYFRGANVDIGNEYLLASIAVVVIGGTSVVGRQGQSSRRLGRGAVPGAAADHAEHVRRQRRRAAAADRPHHRRGDHRGGRGEAGAVDDRKHGLSPLRTEFVTFFAQIGDAGGSIGLARRPGRNGLNPTGSYCICTPRWREQLAAPMANWPGSSQNYPGQPRGGRCSNAWRLLAFAAHNVHRELRRSPSELERADCETPRPIRSGEHARETMARFRPRHPTWGIWRAIGAAVRRSLSSAETFIPPSTAGSLRKNGNC